MADRRQRDRRKAIASPDSLGGWGLAIALGLAILGLTAAVIWGGSQLAQNADLNHRLIRIERVNAACRPGALTEEPVADKCAARFTVGMKVCSLDPKCQAAFLLLLRRARNNHTTSVEKGVIVGGGSNPSGQPGGHSTPSLLDSPLLQPLKPFSQPVCSELSQVMRGFCSQLPAVP